MCVIDLGLFNVLNLHLGQVKVICSVCGKLATRKSQTDEKRERDASDCAYRRRVRAGLFRAARILVVDAEYAERGSDAE